MEWGKTFKIECILITHITKKHVICFILRKFVLRIYFLDKNVGRKCGVFPIQLFRGNGRLFIFRGDRDHHRLTPFCVVAYGHKQSMKISRSGELNRCEIQDISISFAIV